MITLDLIHKMWGMVTPPKKEEVVFEARQIDVISTPDGSPLLTIDIDHHRHLLIPIRSDLKVVEDPTYLNYCRLVVNMSDGIIVGSKDIHPEVLKFIEKSGKPLLAYQEPETYVDAYSAFYDLVLNGSR